MGHPMLVAYESCGCRAAVLFAVSDPGEVADFRNDAAKYGWTILAEQHERIGAHRCAAHAARPA